MKTYLNCVGILVFICVIIGFVVPTMLSAKDTLMVMCGFAMLFVSPMIVFVWGRKVFLGKSSEKKTGKRKK